MGPVDNVRTLLDMCFITFNIVIFMIFNPKFTSSEIFIYFKLSLYVQRLRLHIDKKNMD